MKNLIGCLSLLSGSILVLFAHLSDFPRHFMLGSCLLLLPALLRNQELPSISRGAKVGGLEGNKRNFFSSRKLLFSVCALVNLCALPFFLTAWEGVFFKLWIGSLVLFLLAFSTPLKQLALLFFERMTIREAVPIVLLSLVGMWIRIQPINEFALGHFEAIWGIDSLRMINEPGRSPFHMIGDFPNNFPSFILSYFIQLFPSEYLIGIRLAGVLMGTVSIPAVYLLSRSISNSRSISFSVATLFTTSPWMVNESYFASNFTFYLLLEILFFLSFTLFYRTGNSAAVALCGLLSGILFNMLYVQSTLILVLLLALIASRWLAPKGSPALFARQDLLIALSGFAICISPTVYRCFVDELFPLFRHYEAITLTQLNRGNIAAIDNRPLFMLSHLFSSINDYLLFYHPEQIKKFLYEYYWPPLLSYPFNLLFLAGLFRSIRLIRQPFFMVLVLAFVALYAPLLLREESYYRLHALAPLCFIFATIGLQLLVNTASRLVNAHNSAWVSLGICCSLIAGNSIADYALIQQANAEKITHSSERSDWAWRTAVAQNILELAEHCSFRVYNFSETHKETEYALRLARAEMGPAEKPMEQFSAEAIKEPLCFLHTPTHPTHIIGTLASTLASTFPEGEFLDIPGTSRNRDESLFFVTRKRADLLPGRAAPH